MRRTSLAGSQRYLLQLWMQMDRHRQHPLPIFLVKGYISTKRTIMAGLEITCHCQSQGLIFVGGSDLLVLKRTFRQGEWYIVDVSGRCDPILLRRRASHIL